MFRPERGPLLITTLAIALARCTFREVEFVTDLRGAKLAETLGWRFDHINPALEQLALPGAEFTWAAGKLEALRIQDGPCVQFDGDVLLLKRTLPDWLLEASLIAQSPDYLEFYLGSDMERGFKITGLPRGHTPYNAGLIGGADVALVQDYASEGLELVRRFAGRAHEINGTTASMLCEQYHLGAFAARRGVEVGTLLPMRPTPEQVARAGYAHLVGSYKRDPYYVSRAEIRLQREFPEDYARFLYGASRLFAASPAGSSSWCANI